MSSASELDAVVDEIVDRVGPRLVVGLPLGLGKPNRLVNVLYRRACAEPALDLEIVTALSLDPPRPRHWLEARLMEPILERLFGDDYPRLDYLADARAGRLPGNVRLTEFYFQSGAALGRPSLQRHYISANYTHVARDLVDRGVNVVLQLVARDGDGRISLACNPDVTLDLMRRLDSAPSGRSRSDIFAVGQVHPTLPFLPGDAVVEANFFDRVVEAEPDQRLFALPRAPVSLQDHAVGFHASRLIADGGTLQIGIGSLSDALVHSLVQRHCDNDRYRSAIETFPPALASPEAEPDSSALGDDRAFDLGLFGASEMFMDGFMHLYRAGILKREVFDDLTEMRRTNAGLAVENAGRGAVMEGGFFLGSSEFYAFLDGLDAGTRERFRMHGVSRINQLYGGNEALEIEQRRHARFVNTCMMMTATGAAVSDGLADYQVVSGVGGQYNFVAMAHAMDDGRSVLMLRSTREKDGRVSSNIVWQYPHLTIPRHLRDLVVTEYGIADLRGRTDEECIQRMLSITDARFQDELADQARRAGKLDPAWAIPDAWRANTPERLAERFERAGYPLPTYPFGSDFTAVEQRLIPALEWVKQRSRNKLGLLIEAIRGRPGNHPDSLARLGLDRPRSIGERLMARLVARGLDRTAGQLR